MASGRCWSGVATLVVVVLCILLESADCAPTPQQPVDDEPFVYVNTGFKKGSTGSRNEYVASYVRYEDQVSSVEQDSHGSTKQAQQSDEFLESPAVGEAHQGVGSQVTDESFNMVVQMKRRKRSVSISPDVDWLRQLAPRVLGVAQESEDLIRETVHQHLAMKQNLMVNIINSTVSDQDDIQGTLSYLDDIMTHHFSQKEPETESRSFQSPEERPLVINIFLFNLVATDFEANGQAFPISSGAQPFSAMEAAHLFAQPGDQQLAQPSYPESHAPDLYAGTSAVDSHATGTGHIYYQTENQENLETNAAQPVKEISETSHSHGMSNRVKAMGFSAIPAMAGLATTWQIWWPALAAIGRRKRSTDEPQVEESEEDSGRSMAEGKAIDPQWLSILMGQRYSNSSKEELQKTVENWKYRGKNKTTNVPLIRSTTLRPTIVSWPWISTAKTRPTTNYPSFYRTTSEMDVETTSQEYDTEEGEYEEYEAEGEVSVEDSTSRVNDQYSATGPNSLWYHAGAILSDLNGTRDPLMDNVQMPPDALSSASYHLLPVSASSGDFDIVANFVKSTLTKMSDPSTDGLPMDDQVFVFNTPAIINTIGETTVKTEEPNKSTNQPISVTSPTTTKPTTKSTTVAMTTKPVTTSTTKSTAKSTGAPTTLSRAASTKKSTAASTTPSRAASTTKSIKASTKASKVPLTVASTTAASTTAASTVASTTTTTAASSAETGAPSAALISQSPISSINVFSGVPAMPVLPSRVTNSPVTFVSVKPAGSSPVNIIPIPPPVNQQVEAETEVVQTSAAPSSERTITTKRSTFDFIGEATPVNIEDADIFVAHGTESLYDIDEIDFTSSPTIEVYDDESGITYVGKGIPMPTPAYPDGNEFTTKRPIPGSFYIDPNEIPARFKPTPPAARPVPFTTSSSAEDTTSRTTQLTSTEEMDDPSSTKQSTSNLVTIHSFLASNMPTESVTFVQDSGAVSTVPSGNLVTLHSLLASNKPTTFIPSELTTTQDPQTDSSGNLVTLHSILGGNEPGTTTTQHPKSDATVSTTLKFTHGGYVVETTAPPQYDTPEVSDLVKTQQIINSLLQAYGSGPTTSATSQNPNALVTGDTDTTDYDTDYYDETTGLPVASFNLSDFYTTYSPAEQDVDLDILALFSQLQSNLTTGLVPKPTVSGLHFVNTSTDIIYLSPYDGATPSSVVDIEPLTDVPLNAQGILQPQVEPVIVENDPETIVLGNDPQSIIVDAAPSLEGAPPPSVPDVNSNANLLLSGSESISIGGLTVSSGTSGSSSSTSSTSSVSTSTSSTGGVLFALFLTSLATAVYAGTVLLPIWLPLVLSKKRRDSYPPPRNTYPPARATYSAQTYSATPTPSRSNLGYATEAPEYTYEEIGPLDDYDIYGPNGYHPNHNYDNNKRHRRVTTR